MKKQSRIKDIAQRAGVSTGTVDRVLHHRGEVSAATRERILKIIAELDYQPNVLASTLASRRKIRFAVLIPQGGPTNPYWDAPLQGIRRAATELQAYGIEVDVLTFTGSASFRQLATKILSDPPDGLLLAPVFYDESSRFLGLCAEKQIKAVFIDTQLDYTFCLQKIGQNPRQSGQVAARLMSLGQHDHPRILLLNLSEEQDQLHHFEERARGFSDFFESKSLNATVQHLPVGTDGISLEKTLLESLQSGQIDGIFVTGSKVFQVAALLKKLKQPHIRLIGYDLVDENQTYLKEGIIDFLISQKPEEQGYWGIQALYSGIVLNLPQESCRYTPIDIITAENLSQYLECP